jgi:DNA invertase Pin-like site-specific DNA recombinase/uncharacterized protein YndB with AHSA1/START domain
MRGRVSSEQLERPALVYVRQSTDAQVMEHGESTARQYALADRAVQMGWQPGAVQIIDEDLGRSGASAEGRSGFARVVEEVAHGRAGAVFAVEVSRLARCSNDWQHLLSLCAVAHVPVIDEQSVYDPNDRDDKLLLDLKGTMSEAELYWMTMRLTGGKQNKARRGQLRFQPPVGYLWSEAGLQMDPDEAVQAAIRAVFERYEVEPSAWGVVRWARDTGLQFPVRRWHAGAGSDLLWKAPSVSRVHQMLSNPLYAGVYAYGRRPERKVLVDGQIRVVRESGRDPERWMVRLADAHPGYISWERYVNNQRKLERNQGRFGGSTVPQPKRNPLLLTGMLLCGRCGRRMYGVYRGSGKTSGIYACKGELDTAQGTCWSVRAEPIDEAVERLFLQMAAPEELALGLAVDQQVEKQAGLLAQQWRARIEKAGYEARRAERRYKEVDPDNRVVARTLEREWEERLRELEQVERDYERARTEARVQLTERDRARIRELASDLKQVWKAPTTQQADRKAMLALVMEAITLQPVDVPLRSTRVSVQWKAGAVDELHVRRPSAAEHRKPSAEAVELIRQLAGEGQHDADIAQQLNAEGYTRGDGKGWTKISVGRARITHDIERLAPVRYAAVKAPSRLPDGSWTVAAVAERYGVSQQVVRRWIGIGVIEARRQPFDNHPGMLWLTMDEQTEQRLKDLLGRRAPRDPNSDES